MSKFMLTVVDGHGDTWLYPFETVKLAEAAGERVRKVSDDADACLQIQVNIVEEVQTADQIVDEWKDAFMDRTAKYIVRRINAWDKKDIRFLQSRIAELKTLTYEDGDKIDPQDYLDMSSLPTATIPDDVDTSYPIWSIDETGNCLVGDDATQIETLSSIRETGA